MAMVNASNIRGRGIKIDERSYMSGGYLPFFRAESLRPAVYSVADQSTVDVTHESQSR